LLSYFFVMFLPLICVYLLFAWIHSYNEDQHFAEYIQSTNAMQDMKEQLSDPKYYKGFADYRPIEQLVDNHRAITLYNENGFILYSSDASTNQVTNSIHKKILYEDLYTYKQGYRSFTYKEPVFENNKVVGFFHISVAREEWTEGVVHRTYLIAGIFVIVFILIYVTIIYLVNRKLNDRLTGLMGEMSAFAKGDVLKETEMKKDEIGELKQQFYTMRNQIVEANEAIEEQQREKEYMIATLSHDLKTPLTSIRAYAEALEHEDGLTKQEQQAYHRIITEKSNFMKDMLDDLLTYTLLQSPSYEFDVVTVEGEEFFEMLMSDYERLCKKHRIQLHSEVYVSGTYELHPNQMIRVVDNLVSNAIHHTKEHQNIWIGAYSSTEDQPSWLFPSAKKHPFDFNNNVYIFVQNEGEAIPQEDIPHVFHPLFQVDEARTKQSDHGTGLGLSITKKIIEKHGGAVHLYSDKGYGVCMVCRLPRDKG